MKFIAKLFSNVIIITGFLLIYRFLTAQTEYFDFIIMLVFVIIEMIDQTIRLYSNK